MVYERTMGPMVPTVRAMEATGVKPTGVEAARAEAAGVVASGMETAGMMKPAWPTMVLG